MWGINTLFKAFKTSDDMKVERNFILSLYLGLVVCTYIEFVVMFSVDYFNDPLVFGIKKTSCFYFFLKTIISIIKYGPFSFQALNT